MHITHFITHVLCLKLYGYYYCQFLGFTVQICNKSEWGSTSTVLMFMLLNGEIVVKIKIIFF